MDELTSMLTLGGQYMQEQRLKMLVPSFNRLYVDKKRGHLTLKDASSKHLKHYILSDIVTQSKEDTTLASLTMFDYSRRLPASMRSTLNDLYNRYREEMGNHAMEVVSFPGSNDTIERLQEFADHNLLPHYHAFEFGPYIYPQDPWTDDIGRSVYTRKDLRADVNLDRLYQFANWCDEDRKRF